MKISEVMNKVIVIDHDINLREAAKIMSDKNIGSLVVIKDDRILGIITDHDIINNVGKLDSRVSSVMSRSVSTIEKSDTIEHAADMMAKKKIKRIPVVDGDKLIGIITATDIIAHVEEVNEDFFFD